MNELIEKQRKKALNCYNNAEKLTQNGVSEYHKLSEYGNVVLATKMTDDKQFSFVTWEYDYDKKGVHHGHYYNDDYQGAKRDFIIRSGLLPQNMILDKINYSLGKFRLHYDIYLDSMEEKDLEEILDDIEELYPEECKQVLESIELNEIIDEYPLGSDGYSLLVSHSCITESSSMDYKNRC